MNIRSLVVTAVLATAILCSGGVVSAQTATDNSALIAQLKAQIASLMAQLQTIQAQQGITAGTAATWCHTFNTNLGFINSGTTDISALHTVLQKEGIAYGTDSDTTYAEDTSAAVVQFQAKYGIAQTGYVGTKTRMKLNDLYGCSTALPACTPNWTCGWSSCVNGSQTQGLADSNNCGLPLTNATIGCPTLTQACNSTGAPACLNGAGALLPGQSYCSHSSVITLKASCYTSPSSTTVNHQVSWFSSVSGGSGTYAYKWSGAVSGTGSQESASFAMPGTMPATLTVKDSSGASVTANCSVSVTPGTSTQSGNTCTPSWSCAGFANSACTNGQQTQVCVDANQCGVTTGMPSLTQACTVSAAPSITITSPNGGETWVQGSTHNITWTANFLSSKKVWIRLINRASGVESIISDATLDSGAVLNSGSFQWVVPTTIASGTNYYIEIMYGWEDIPGYVQIVNHSNSFSITAPAAVIPLSASCSSVSSAPVLGQRINWTSTVSGGSGSYTYNWSSSASQIASAQTASPASPGITSESLTVEDSAGNSTTATCSVNVLQTTPAAGTGCNAAYQCVTGGTGAPCSINSDCATATNGGPVVVHCSAQPAVAAVGDSVTWTAIASGAKRGEFYKYVWQGDATGTGVTTGSFYGLPAMTYTTVGTKTAFVTITVSGGTALATCSAIIVATPADIAKATTTQTSATPLDATQATMTIGTPTQATVSSGQNVRLTLTLPHESHSSLYFACPAGVSMRTSPETCNTNIDTTMQSGWSPAFFNSTSQDQNVTATYSVVTSSGTSTATTTITVHPQTTALNLSQNGLASISDAIANIVAEIKAMLNK